MLDLSRKLRGMRSTSIEASREIPFPVRIRF
jgi:hypothetical protein